MAYEKNPDEIGALWSKTGNRGPYMTGKIDGIGDVVLFAIENKTGNPKAPSWRVLKSKPREAAIVSNPGAREALSDGDGNW